MTPCSYVKGQSLVVAESISMKFGGNMVLGDISFSVENIRRPEVNQGQVVIFLGGSGRGKTTLARILAGLQQPTSGRVLVGNPPKPVKAGTVGMLWQNHRLFEYLTVCGNVELACNRIGLYGSAARNRAMELLEFVGMGGHASKYPCQLSGGESQRAAIVQQVACSQHYLVLDEPTSGLDLKNKELVCDLITKVSQLNEENTVFIISHDVRSMVRVGDTAHVLGHGQRAGEESQSGSVIKKSYWLPDMGLAWKGREIYDCPEYEGLCRELDDLILHDS